MKALRFQLKSILNALEEVPGTINDLLAKSEDVTLSNDIGNILRLVIWYNILTEVNIVSKSEQDHNMNMSDALRCLCEM